MATDPMAGLRKTQLMMSITERAVRAWRLGEWALLHQVRPDGSSAPPDPRPFMPDRGSSLAFDDLDFTPDLGKNPVTSTARYPVMTAAENLVGAAQAHSASLQEGRTNVVSLGSLCRCAIEGAAKTVWLLAPTVRTERRARCRGFIQSERQPQQSFLRIEARVLAKRQSDGLPADLPNFQRHRDEYDERQVLISALPKSERTKPPSNSSDIVSWSAKWIDANPPAHASDELPLGMELGADRFYSIGSSFVHGFKWMTDYIRDDEATLKVVAEGFAAAVVMTECAVCLFEAQATNAARAAVRRANYPDWLAPTVAAWLPRYQ
ncbi:hypothetical protein [Mycolicibacterium gilvum]|nr:hypothetical protein [Mycolicibacterium gilvum]MCV7057754.1 hypothetical protein [Mycolicibacterium gilvum]